MIINLVRISHQELVWHVLWTALCWLGQLLLPLQSSIPIAVLFGRCAIRKRGWGERHHKKMVCWFVEGQEEGT